jgi:hypothetical protein
MNRILLIILLPCFSAFKVSGQSFSARDLLSLTDMPSGGINNYMVKKGFVLNRNFHDDTIQLYFIPFTKGGKKKHTVRKNLGFYQHDHSRYFIYRTEVPGEFADEIRRLKKSDFVYDKRKDISKDSLILFQKRNISIDASVEVKDSIPQYTFKLRQRKIPDSIEYAEDLLQFDSNEFLVSYFGDKNVTQDLYYLSENNLKKCSVLFSGTLYQVAFVWGDERDLDNLSYIIVSNLLPTKKGKQNSIVNENNSWKFKCGIHHGMDLRDLLRLNEMDFDIYGTKSQLAFMADPVNKGKINFKKTAVMFNCNNCYDNQIFDQTEISALDIAKARLPLRIFDIIIYP